MLPKPQTKAGYDSQKTQLVRASCVEIMSRLDSLKANLVIVGGLVPTLLIPPAATADDHIGTIDIDLGLTLALIQDDHYHGLVERLKGAGFQPDEGKAGKTVQRWRQTSTGIIVDFLMPTQAGEAPGLQPLIGGEFGAFRTPALQLAFEDREWRKVTATIPGHGNKTRTIPICGPAAFIVLKGLALEGRSEPKDAYDLHFMITRYSDDLDEIPRRLVTLSGSPDVDQALTIIDRHFADLDSEGTYNVATFLGRQDDEGFRADVAGAVGQMLAIYKRLRQG